ncbi:hypothetical protein KJ596_04015 [Patescibacteria group bacterium]|nr:hypothetical protein [Patescibacteria group bacterium]MBU1868336.1 hypothetical protein [Patescibacteria group bacterium]
MIEIPNLNQLIENLSLGSLAVILEKWGVIAFSVLLLIFSVLILKQMTLLDQFLPTPGGKLLKRVALAFTIAIILLLLASIFLT